jgi:peptide/nickel transport system substrate-binding protein
MKDLTGIFPGNWGRRFTVVLILGCTAACAPAPTQTPLPTVSPSPQAEPASLTVALAYAPTSLDPADHRTRSSETVIRNIFDGLVTRDHLNKTHLELAQGLTWVDENTLEIVLRRDVYFHDGVRMTADDVVFSFERIVEENAIEYPEPHTSPRKSLIAPLESVEKIDDFMLHMHFTGPWPPAEQLLVHQQIVPKHVFEAIGTEGFVRHPIGTGPFKFVSATDDYEEVVLERFDQYYGGAPGLPPVGTACIDRVVFKVIPDVRTRAAALLMGEVDIIQALTVELAEALRLQPGIVVKTAPSTQPIWLELNVNNPLFDHVRERQALNYAIDKERIIMNVYQGNAIALPGPLSPYNTFVHPELGPYPYNPVRAMNYLNQLGWTQIDREEVDPGNRSIPVEADDRDSGTTLVNLGLFYTFVIDTLPEFQPLAAEISNQLLQLGIRTEVRVWDPEIIRPQFLAGERMAYLDDWGDSAFDPVGHFDAKWHGQIEGQVYGRGNFSGYNNEHVNALVREGETTSDPAKRREIYEEAQEIIYEEAPAVFLVLPEVIEAASSRVQNWEPSSDGRINLHDVCIAP